MITELFEKLTAGASEKKAVTLSNNGGILIIDVDEATFTPQVKEQIDRIDFNFYLNDGTDEPKKVLFATKTWESLEDRAIAFNQVPASAYVEAVVVLNDSSSFAENLIPVSEFPIKVSISDENILSRSGGSGASEAEIDTKISEHNTSPTAHEDIRQLVSKAVKYKGSVENYSDLPTNPADGDMYNIVNADLEHQINAGDNVVWVADSQIWDNLGGFIDLSQLQVMMDFPSWLTEAASSPTKTMDDVIKALDDNVTTIGVIYAGEFEVSDLPNNSMNRVNAVIEVLKSSNTDFPVYQITIVSDSVAPYLWTSTSQYAHGFSGWQERPTSEDLINLKADLTDEIGKKQDTLTFDDAPTEGSDNPVKSGGIFTALSDKVNTTDLTDYVKNTDYATSSKVGVVRAGQGLAVNPTGAMYISQATQTYIDARTDTFKPITPYVLNIAVKAALTDAKRISDLTDDEKVNARGVIGALGSSDLDSYVKDTDYATTDKAGIIRVGAGFKIVNGTTLYPLMATNADIDARTNEYEPIVPANLDYAVRSVYPVVNSSVDTIVRNCIYDLGEQSTLTIALPTTSNVGDWLQFDFMSGATATTLSITSTAGLLGYDLIPESNTIYSLYLDWGIINKTGDTMTYGWRFSYSEYPIGA